MKTAVFYDLENIGLPIKNGQFEVEFDKLLGRIRDSHIVGDIAIQKAYISKSNYHAEKIEPILNKKGCELVKVEPLDSAKTQKSNLVDFAMNVDVIATISSKRSIKTIAIASGDKDFGFMTRKLKDMGKDILLVSRYNITGQAMFQLCDDWVNLGSATFSTKEIFDVIRKRMTNKYDSGNLIQDVSALLNDFEKDLFARRVLTHHGFPIGKFVEILSCQSKSYLQFPGYGYGSAKDFCCELLKGTRFECKGDLIGYNPEKPVLSDEYIVPNLTPLPAGFSYEKLLEYYDFYSEMGSYEEFQTYVSLMKRCGIIREDSFRKRKEVTSLVKRRMGELSRKIELLNGSKEKEIDELGTV